MGILGGLGTLIGPVIGAALITLLRHELSDLTDYWGLWLGVFLILAVMGGKNGVVGWLEAGWNLIARRRQETKPADRSAEDAAG